MKTNNKRILVTDDDTLVRKLLDTFLTFCGYNVECASTGKEAVALIEAHSYDVLITDYMMPEMNGIELIKKVRDIKKSLAIIGISASEEERAFLAAGANSFIAKPFSPDELKNTIEKICST